MVTGDETATVSITVGAETDEVTVPSGILDVLAEEGQSDAEALGDVVMLSIAGRAHHMVHHGDGSDEQLAADEALAMELFEERFGVSFAEATGHSH